MTSNIVRLDLGEEIGPDYDGAWVEFKGTRTFGDQLDVRAAYRISAEEGVVAGLVHAITGWSFEQEPSRETLRALSPRVGGYLEQRIFGHYIVTERGDADTKASSAPNSKPSSEMDEFPASTSTSSSPVSST